MTSSEGTKPNFTRRFLWFAIGILAAMALYTAGWFAVADTLMDSARATIARLNGEGTLAECERATPRGYPFRIGLFCDRARYIDPDGRVALQSSTFRTAAQIYNPYRVIGELGEVRIDVDTPRLAADYLVRLQGVRFSARLASPLPETVSVEGRDVSISGSANLASAEAAEAHMRRNGDDLDLAFRFSGLELLPGLLKGARARLGEGNGDVTVFDGIALVENGAPGLRGQKGVIRSLAVATSPDSGLTVSGPMSVDANGLIDADLRIVIRNPKAVAAFLGSVAPANRDQIESGFAGLALLGDNPELPLMIRKGRAQLGLIPLGVLPPVE